jgi:hypothetical protein
MAKTQYVTRNCSCASGTLRNLSQPTKTNLSRLRVRISAASLRRTVDLVVLFGQNQYTYQQQESQLTQFYNFSGAVRAKSACTVLDEDFHRTSLR